MPDVRAEINRVARAGANGHEIIAPSRAMTCMSYAGTGSRRRHRFGASRLAVTLERRLQFRCG